MSASTLSRKLCIVGVLQRGSRSSSSSLTVCYLAALSVMLCDRERILPSVAVSFLLTIVSVIIPYSIHFDEVVPGSREADSPFCSLICGSSLV